MKTLAAFGLVLAAGATANSDGRLSPLQAPGFAVGFEQANPRGEITERVPTGETVERWTAMLTEQRFTGLAAQATPRAYASNVLNAVPGFCPGGKAGITREFSVSQRPALTLRVDCPRNPQTGLAETTLMLIVAGPRDMHVRQVAWRRKASAADLAFGQQVFDATRWCARTAKGFAC